MFRFFKENETLQRIKEHIVNNQATWGTAILAVSKTLLDNYWVFTGIPLGENGSGAGIKLLYLTAQVAVNGGLGAVVGHGVDQVRQMRPNYQQI